MTEEAVPEGVRRWSWGAFFLTWIWGIGNGVWISLLALVPVVNIVMIFILGAKGNEWAWKARHWDSKENFLLVQKNWAIAGLGIWILFVLGGILYSVAIPQYEDYHYASKANDRVANFHKVIIAAETAEAAATVAGQNTDLSKLIKLPAGTGIVVHPTLIGPSTSFIMVILKPSSMPKMNDMVAQSMPQNGIIGCGNSGGCIAEISNDGSVKYNHYPSAGNVQNENHGQLAQPLNKQDIATPTGQLTEQVSQPAVFHRFSSGSGFNEVGSPAEGPLLIGHHGEWLVSTVNSNPVGTGYDFGSFFGKGTYQVYGEVSYKGKNYYIFRNAAGEGQTELAKWQVAWRGDNGKFRASQLFGSGAYESNIKTSSDKIIFEMVNPPNGEITYTFTMGRG